MDDGPIKSVVVHAVYLINTATEDAEMRKKSLVSLTHALRMGDAIGADGVVLHAGSALKGDKGQAMKRAGKVLREALAETERCPLLLEDTAGSGATLGRSFDELAELIRARRRPEAAGDLPGLVPPAGQRLRRAHRG